MWCLIKQDELISPPDVHGPVTLRTVHSICDDHKRFVNAGSILKNVKNFNNCLNEPFFQKFPLTQVKFINYKGQILNSYIILTGVPSRLAYYTGHLFEALCTTRSRLPQARFINATANEYG